MDTEADLETPYGILPTQQQNKPHQHEPQPLTIEQTVSWGFADFGQVRQLSRDFSTHATDEVINSASHLAATMLSVLGTALLIAEASYQGNVWKIVTFSLYGFSLIFLFACSTLHHSVTASARTEEILRMLDYIAIYPLIAGTFSPLTLVFYHDSPVGWVFFGSVWGLAIMGMILTVCLFRKMPKWMSMTMYITLGWFGACFMNWLLPMTGWSGVSIMILGGLFYTIGGAVFSLETPNPIPGRFGFHEIWHIAVILGAFTHWLLIYIYVAPYGVEDEEQ